jgi:hypothetical protein
MRLADNKIDKVMVIANDSGNLMMPYAKSMDISFGIYDGSKHSSTNGYHLYQVTGSIWLITI